MTECKCCGTVTKNPKYCSKSCSAKINNLVPKRKRKERLCRSCGSKTTHLNRRLICESCTKQRDRNSRTLAEFQGKRKYQINSQVRDCARVEMKNRGIEKLCRKCGYSNHVHVCHITPISSFSPDTPVSDINSENNLIYLCPNHHWELDNNLLSLDFVEFDDLHS